MSANGWIIVRNWERFQHPDVLRSDTEPAWIKVYTRLLHNPDYEALTWQQRGILMTIWIDFAASDGQLAVTSLPQSGHRRVRASSLQALVDAGFIELSASRPLASRKQVASTEKIREEIKDRAHARNASNNGTTPEARERFVRTSGYLLEEDLLEAELSARGASESERIGLVDLAADLRREGKP